MKKRFIYHDEKSNKFWWIDYEGDSLAVNYGKVGSIGKFQTKEFDNEEQCLKEASKLIAAKMKKGYQEDPKFNFMDRYYFDDEEIGLHVKTSHPNFQGSDSNLLIVFYVQIMPDDLVMQLHRF
ncbi:hypothetical protein VEE57_36220 [Escherichia coli]|nr:hypothetical protein VEE57_36220 [Escherichia coli]